MSHELIQVRTEGGKVGVVTLNRPKQLNALNDQLMDELGAALKAFDADPAIGCMIVTGSEKAFAAGADIGAMATYSFADVYKGDYITRNWEQIRQIRKPVIAAVSGFALPTTRDSANRRSNWASFPVRAVRSVCHARWARPRRWIWRSPGA